jgi:hypothetical protein
MPLFIVSSSDSWSRRGNGQCNVRCVALSHGGDHFLGGGVHDLEGLARLGRNMLAVDQQQLGPLQESRGFGTFQ